MTRLAIIAAVLSLGMAALFAAERVEQASKRVVERLSPPFATTR